MSKVILEFEPGLLRDESEGLEMVGVVRGVDRVVAGSAETVQPSLYAEVPSDNFVTARVRVDQLCDACHQRLVTDVERSARSDSRPSGG